MPALVRMYIRHTLIGFALAAAFVALLFWFDVAGLWHLVTHTEGGWIAAGLLVLFNGIVFSGAQFGIAVMSMARDENDRGPGRRDALMHDAIPVPVRVQEAPRRRR
jgi:hypothetical protein